MQAESYIQGGSTITQQLVKNFFLTPDRTMRRKLQEALLAFVLERRAAKKEILELYLNEVYLGQIGSFSIHGLGDRTAQSGRGDAIGGGHFFQSAEAGERASNAGGSQSDECHRRGRLIAENLRHRPLIGRLIRVHPSPGASLFGPC